MKTLSAILSFAIALFSCGLAYGQDKPPAGCDRASNRLDCVIYYGTLSKSQSGPGIVGGVQTGTPEGNAQRFVVFIHASKDQAALVEQIKTALAAKKYNLRGIDEQGIVGGSAVDYFREEDRQGAQAIADLINEMLPPGLSKLAPRLQLVSNPPGFIGVWLPAQVTGWYYLGKLSGDRKQWLESSAADTLRFSLPVEPGRDIVEQLKNPAIEVSSKGYKYLRTTDSAPGHRVNGKVSMTLAPKVRVRIKEIDATGVDPADGQTVLWALIEIVR